MSFEKMRILPSFALASQLALHTTKYLRDLRPLQNGLKMLRQKTPEER